MLADACVAVDDGAARRAMAQLANPQNGDPEVDAGPSGACGLATLVALCEDGSLAAVRRASRIDHAAEVIIINTEAGSGFGTPESHERTQPSP